MGLIDQGRTLHGLPLGGCIGMGKFVRVHLGLHGAKSGVQRRAIYGKTRREAKECKVIRH